MLFLSFGDAPSGVLSSQVFDVVKYCRTLTKQRIICLAFISVRGYFKNRVIIKNQINDCWVVPMYPTIHLWRFNLLTLAVICLLTKQRNIIARNAMAVNLALAVKKTGLIKKIALDGRGAIAAEWNEYDVMPNKKLKSEINEIEKTAVLQSDFRLAVSNPLVHYWHNRYGYNSKQHVIIPCTISFEKTFNNIDIAWPYHPHEIVLVYAGSVAGWQSFDLLKLFLNDVLTQTVNHQVLFLSKTNTSIETLKQSFPNQVKHMWLPHEQVLQILERCDYGILIREQTVTNEVASPTKFAEYLSAGLDVLISEKLGDYTAFVQQNNCGIVWEPGSKTILLKSSVAQKNHNKILAQQHFSKEAFKSDYMRLLEAMA
ncbi:MAG: hypothetical protein JNK61_11380 [Bacteroidia bacterium]|nr:hypothetical protein [Bacteroidia bacterium]HQV00280.1 hypothetical protein [Bacteroidia bacterium]